MRIADSRILCVSNLYRGLLCFLILIFPLLVSDKVRAQNGAYEIGDKVVVSFLGDEYEAEVVGKNRVGWIEAKFIYDGRAKTSTFSPRRVLRKVESMEPEESAEDPDELSEWTDITGKHKVLARFVRLTDDSVTLKKEDGDSVTLPISRLSTVSAAKAKHLNAMMKGNSSGANANPFRQSSKTDNSRVQKGETVDLNESVSGWGLVSSASRQWSIPNQDHCFKFPLAVGHGKTVLSDSRHPTRVFVALTEPQIGGFVLDLEKPEKIGPFKIPERGRRIVAYDAVNNRLVAVTGSIFSMLPKMPGGPGFSGLNDIPDEFKRGFPEGLEDIPDEFKKGFPEGRKGVAEEQKSIAEELKNFSDDPDKFRE